MPVYLVAKRKCLLLNVPCLVFTKCKLTLIGTKKSKMINKLVHLFNAGRLFKQSSRNHFDPFYLIFSF